MNTSLDALIAEFRNTGTLSGLPCAQFIYGAYQAGATSAALASFDPGRGRLLAQFAAGGEAGVDAAVHAAKPALPAWSETAPAERSRVLWAIAQQVRRNADRMALIASLHSGQR